MKQEIARKKTTDKVSWTPEIRQRRALRRLLRRWFDTPLGRSVEAAEASQLYQVLGHLYGTTALQLGRIGELDLMDACIAPTRILLDQEPVPGTRESPSRQSCVGAHLDALPLDTKSIDVAVLPHTLDFEGDPHRILREVDRVLSPEGHMVIIGFNPYSFWGLRRLFGRRKRRMAPWNAHFFSMARIKDWMSLLGYEVTETSTVFHRPPVRHDKLRSRLFFMERLGTRWWSGMAGVYIVVAKKRVVGMTPLQPSWKQNRQLVPGLTEPAAKVIHPNIPQWRLRRDSQG